MRTESRGTFALTAGDYAAQIDAVGASLISLSYQGRDLLYDATGSDGVPTPAYRGMMLVPWPNRIRDGQYEFGGQRHQLPVNEVDRATALHGLALWDTWQAVEHDPAAVTLMCVVSPRPGYPFRIRMATRFTIDATVGLTVELTATNIGSGPAPYGASFHPYFRADSATLDNWTLTLPAREVITVDDRLLPTGAVEVAGSRFDFTRPRPLAGESLDHAFTGVVYDSSGHADAELRTEDGSGVRVGWDAACAWVQVYTLDQPGHAMDRGAVAIEPMTCAPDAFNSGAGLVVLNPGDLHLCRWQITSLPAR